MLRRDLMDRYDMERRVHERLFCFGSGSQEAADEARASATPAQTDDEGRPLVRGTTNVIDASRQILPPQNNDPEPVAAAVNQPPRGTADFDISQVPPAADPFQAPINTIDGILSQLNALEERDRQRRAMFGGQTAADVQALNAQTGEVYYDERTGTYKAGSLPGLIVDRTPPPYNEIEMYSVPRTRANINVAGTNLPPAIITDEAGTTFDTTNGEIIQPTVMGMEDEYDPFAGTGRTAMDLLNYDLDDQSGPAGRIRPFAGLTRAQQADLEARDDFVAQQILDAQTAQPSGIPTTNLTGIYTEGDAPMGNVRGFANFGPELPFLGPTQVFTGFGGDPFAAQAQVDDDQTTPPETNPLTGASRCPDGFIFDEGLQTCRRKTTAELAETGSGGSPAPIASGGGAAAPQPGDIFYRRSILDDAPANLPQGFDFDAANRRFIQSYGVRPENYRMPLSLTGFTAL